MKKAAGFRNFSKSKDAPAVAVVALISMLLALFARLTCFGAWSDLPANLHAVMPILHNEAANSSAANVLLMNSCEAASSVFLMRSMSPGLSRSTIRLQK